MGEARTLQKAFVARFEIAPGEAEVLRRFYALLFGWRFSAGDVEDRKVFVVTADSTGIGGVITSVGDGKAGGVQLIVEVDDIFENLSYAEELGGTIIDPPHDIVSAGRRMRVASFADPEGNRVGLCSGLQQVASAEMTA